MDNNVIFKELNKNEDYLKNTLGQFPDINYRHIIIPALGNSNALIVNINGMNDRKEVDAYVVAPLVDRLRLPKDNYFTWGNKKITLLMESGLFTAATKESNLWNDLCDAIIAGNTVLFLDKCNSALILSTRNFEHRTVSEPIIEAEIRGPRDGFVENIQANMALIRTRIKDYGLRFETLKIGQRTKTDIALAYINSLANESILDELRKRLNRINIDAILESANIEELIEDAPNSIFPQIEHTERPDKASAAILDGRIVILVDNTPFTLIIPSIFWRNIYAMGDNYERRFAASFLRCIRAIAIFLSLSLSSYYVLLTSFHQEMLPTSLALKTAEGRAGVPFPATLEAFVMEFSLQVMKEAGLRMPQPIGQIVGIVGTFIIGQAAVSAGIVGPVLVIFIALAAICSFAVPSNKLGTAIRLLSYMLLILSSIFGIIGYLGGVMVVFLHLLSLRSFGEPFLAPIFPHFKDGLKSVFIREPRWKMTQRPLTSGAKDMNKQTTEPLMPKPPPTK